MRQIPRLEVRCGRGAHAEVFRGPGGDWNASALVRVPPKLLITGASGFVGRALTLQAAARGLPLRIALRRPELELAQGFERRRFPGWTPIPNGREALEGVAVVAHCRRPRACITRNIERFIGGI